MSVTTKPTVYYYKSKGRGEIPKIALSLARVGYNFEAVDGMTVKSDLEQYPFGQCPRYTDESVDLVQTSAILRHIGRKHDLYGQGLKQQAKIDEFIDGCSDLLASAVTPLFIDTSAERQAQWWSEHGDPASRKERNGGAHLAHLQALMKSGPGPFTMGKKPTIADAIMLFILEKTRGTWGQQLESAFPDLIAYHEKMLKLPELEGYFAS